jgi:hypothetical protein
MSTPTPREFFPLRGSDGDCVRRLGKAVPDFLEQA